MCYEFIAQQLQVTSATEHVLKCQNVSQCYRKVATDSISKPIQFKIYFK